MDRSEIKKDDYLIFLNKQSETFIREYNSLKMRIESKDFPNEVDVQNKYQKLKGSIERFSWKIHHLRNPILKLMVW